MKTAPTSASAHFEVEAYKFDLSSCRKEDTVTQGYVIHHFALKPAIPVFFHHLTVCNRFLAMHENKKVNKSLRTLESLS